MRRSVWTLSWSLLASTACGARGSSGGFSMLWAVSVTMREIFWPLTRRTRVGSLRVKPCWEGWTSTVCWTRARTSSITCWLLLWRTFSSAGFRPSCSSLAWPSLSTMPECSSGKGTLGKKICVLSLQRVKSFAFFPCVIFIICELCSSFCVVEKYH